MKETLEMDLEALTNPSTIAVQHAIANLKIALAQLEQRAAWQGNGGAGYNVGGTGVAKPEQEPVAFIEQLTGKPKLIGGYVVRTDADIPLYMTPPKREWVSLNNMDITGAAHDEAIHPVFILETTKSGLCMKFSKSGEWHCSDKNGDYMIINNFLMSFAKAIEAKLKEKNGG